MSDFKKAKNILVINSSEIESEIRPIIRGKSRESLTNNELTVNKHTNNNKRIVRRELVEDSVGNATFQILSLRSLYEVKNENNEVNNNNNDNNNNINCNCRPEQTKNIFIILCVIAFFIFPPLGLIIFGIFYLITCRIPGYW